EIYTYLPKPDPDHPENDMQVIMLSATLVPGIEGLMKRFAPTHQLFDLNKKFNVAEPVKHIQYLVSHPRKKYRLLVYLLKRRANMRDKQVLVFVRTKQRANRVRDNLVRDGFKAE